LYIKQFLQRIFQLVGYVVNKCPTGTKTALSQMCEKAGNTSDFAGMSYD